MGYLRCPECGKELILCVDTICVCSQRIKADGSIGKKTSSSISNTTGSPYLQCEDPRCSFSYDVEHASNDEPIKEVDDWISEHLEEIYRLN